MKKILLQVGRVTHPEWMVALFAFNLCVSGKNKTSGRALKVAVRAEDRENVRL